MLRIIFEYKDKLTEGKWARQECWASSIAKCKEMYSLGDGIKDYNIIYVENEGNGPRKKLLNGAIKLA